MFQDPIQELFCRVQSFAESLSPTYLLNKSLLSSSAMLIPSSQEILFLKEPSRPGNCSFNSQSLLALSCKMVSTPRPNPPNPSFFMNSPQQTLQFFFVRLISMLNPPIQFHTVKPPTMSTRPEFVSSQRTNPEGFHDSRDHACR